MEVDDLPLEKKVFDYAYNASSAANYHLSIQLNQGNLLFLLIHVAENKAIGFGKTSIEQIAKADAYAKRVQDWLENPMFSLPFQSVDVYFSGKYSTLIPSGLFSESHALDFLKFNYRLQSNSSVSHNKISSLEAYIVFSYPLELKSVLEKKFVNYRLKHSSCAILSYFKEYSLRNPDPNVILDVEEDFFHLLVGKEKKLLLYNFFPYTNPEDFLYYMLYALEKLKINSEETSVMICGKTNVRSSEFELLHRYFKKISFLNEHPGLESSFRLKEFESSRYFKLFNQYLCE